MAQRIPQSFIDDLITRVDIVDVIDSRVPLRKTGVNYSARCPFHEENTPSFTVSPTKQFYHCFGCGAHGTAIGFLMEYERLGFVEAVEELARRVGVALPQEARASETAPTQPLYETLEQAAKFYRRQLREHGQAARAVDYLKGRGVSGEIAAEFGIGYAPAGWDNLQHALGSNSVAENLLVQAGLLVERDGGGRYDRFRDRIMFPIRDMRGRVIAFGGRVLGDDTPKYLNSPETPVFHKGQELYGLHEARKAQRHWDRLLVVEGYMDVVALAQFGVRNAVATLGTAITAEHLQRLFRTVNEVVFCFDGDRAGREAAWRALENSLPALRDGVQARFMFLPDGEDPDTLVRKEGAQAFEARVTGAQTFSQYLFAALMQQTDVTTFDGRARLKELAVPLLSNLPQDGALRQMLFTELAALTRTEEIVAQRWDKAQKATRTASKPNAQRSPPPAGATLARVALALLLRRPTLAALVPDPHAFVGGDVPGLDLLVEMLELLHAHPHLGPGALLEHWRDHPHGRHLATLAQWQHPVPDEGVEMEFLGAIQRLWQQVAERRIEGLLAKSRASGLSADEKSELQRLLSGPAGMSP